MNKYQNALERLSKIDLNMVLDELGYERAQIISDYGMNDYPNIEMYGDISVLKELVEKETPKKVYKKYYSTKYGNNGRMKRVDIRCPCCASGFTNGTRTSIGVLASREKDFIETINNQNYCWNCSQKLDWSDEE